MRSRSVDPEACWPCVVEETECGVIIRVESALAPRLSFRHESAGFSLHFRPWEFLDLNPTPVYFIILFQTHGQEFRRFKGLSLSSEERGLDI